MLHLALSISSSLGTENRLIEVVTRGDAGSRSASRCFKNSWRARLSNITYNNTSKSTYISFNVMVN